MVRGALGVVVETLASVPALRLTLWICCHQMCQIGGWREHSYTLSKLLREVPKISRHEPCACVVRQRQERQIFRVWPTMWPLHGIGKAHALFDEELQPKRRKPETVKLWAFYDGPVLFDDLRVGDQLYLPFQNPIHDEFCWCPIRLYARGDDDVRVEDNKSHLAFRRLRTLRTCLISSAISSAFIWSKPVALA
jgi:hypothetical protein